MIRLSIITALALAVVAAGATAGAQTGTVTVYAAASLREAFDAAAPAFTKQTGFTVTFSFGGSDTLVTQLKQGAPADVFASANDAQMKVASDAGLLDGPARTFARNRLVVIYPNDNPGKITQLADLARPGVKVVLAAKTVPVGAYARSALHNLSEVRGYPPAFDAAVEKNVVSDELDVKAVATKISLGEGDAGIVYATDVTGPIAAKVKSFALPRDAAPDATYPIAVLKAAPNAAGARAFTSFILSPAGQRYLRARGFIAP
jgi:molybdate transport system substrate-binding protein